MSLLNISQGTEKLPVSSSGETLDLKSAISSDLFIACLTPWDNAM